MKSQALFLSGCLLVLALGAQPSCCQESGSSPLPGPPSQLTDGGTPDAAGTALPGMARPGVSGAPAVRGLAWKSALCPGWGQWAGGRRRRAALIGLPALGLLGASVWAGWAERREVHAYDGALDASAALEHARRAEDLRSLATAFVSAGAGLWLFGIVDASLTPEGRGLRVGVRFR